MFASSVLDKENIHGEVLVSTPARKPLKTLQAISQNAVSEGTPLGLLKKTPKHKLSNITPGSKNYSRRISKRQSVPLRLPKTVSIFDDEMFYTQTTMVNTPTNMTQKIKDCEETGLHESQELNEMLRKKVFETVTKLRKRYELCLAEKEKDLQQQCCIINQLKKEVDILKQDQMDSNKTVKSTTSSEQSQNLCEDEQVSLLVQHLLSKVVKETENSNYAFGEKIDSATGPITPVGDVHSTTTPMKQINSETSVNSLRQMFPEKSETSIKQVSTETSMIPVSVRHSEISMTPVEQVDALTLMTPIKQTNSETSMTPLKLVNSHTTMTPVHIQETSSDHSNTPTTSCANVATTMTPIEHVNQATMVSPITTHSTAVVTSPLVAVLQPEMITRLPLETLRAELESAAISNELLRGECDELNRKVEDLESLLKEVRNSASKESDNLQERVDQLQKELEEALEINYQMELKKPNSIEEYEDVIQRLQKDVLLKEKQIAFYTKKASETDNLQNDLRRMYAKYTVENLWYYAFGEKIDSATGPITPVGDVHSTTTPMKQINSETSVNSLRQMFPEKSETSIKQVSTETSMIPVSVRHSEISMTPVEQVDALTLMTPIKQTNSETSMTPLKLVNSHTTMTPVHIQETSSDHSNTPTTSCANVATTMTPIEHVNQATMVSPITTHSTAVVTSPLVAVLQPEMITRLPLETLRAELESAAISNELLRGECDELNRKVEDLESLLKEVRNSASKESDNLQERVDQLQKELEEALEINYQMELKKPNSIEEYEDVIQRLQKDVLLKEKQIAFYTKKASETDNLQNDLRRMYAKYTVEHESSTELNKKMKSLACEHNVKRGELEAMQAERNDLRIELSEAKATIDEQEKIWEEEKRTQVKCCTLEEQMKTFQCQQKENMEFVEQERKGLEETNVELEQMVRKYSVELDGTKHALEEKTSRHEHLREAAHSLRTQLSEVQDELNAVQSQAHLVMLEQERELTTVTRVLEEAWERLNTMIRTVRKQALSRNEEKGCKSDKEDIVKDKNECDSSAFKPSLVCSVLVAVSATAAPPADGKISIVSQEDNERPLEVQSNSFVEDSPSSEDEQDPSNFTLVDRALSLSELLRELEDYTCGSVAREQAKKHTDEINNLENNLAETRQQYEIAINVLKRELAKEYDAVKEGQRDNDHKQIEIESLKMVLQTTEQNFQISRERMTELGERYCRLIEQETENEALNENLGIVQRECERLKKERSLLKKELNETMQKLRETFETNDEPDVGKRKTEAKKNFTELFEEKLKLQREVEKLSDSYSKSRMEKETFTHYNAKLETKASILANNLVKAEEEIYRLDGIIDRFCSVAQQNREMAAQNKDLCDLLKELNINIE